MRIMRATSGGEVAWVACMGPNKWVHGYLAQTNQFHYSHALDDDYYWEMDFEYVDIDPAAAVSLINAGAGRLDDSKSWVVERLVASESILSAEEVLGEAAADIHREVSS